MDEDIRKMSHESDERINSLLANARQGTNEQRISESEEFSQDTNERHRGKKSITLKDSVPSPIGEFYDTLDSVKRRNTPTRTSQVAGTQETDGQNRRSILKQKEGYYKAEISSCDDSQYYQGHVERVNVDEINLDAYEIDYSMLMKLPKSIITEAIEYAKRKRKEEEKKAAEKDDYIRLKCIPPWAKTYGTMRQDASSTIGTQYEIPSYLRLIEEGEDEYGEEHTQGKRKKKGQEDKSDEEDETKSVTGSYAGSEKTAVSTKTDVGVQIAPEMHPFGMQTDLDSLTKLISSNEKLLASLPHDQRIMLLKGDLSKIDSKLIQDVLASLNSEERLEFLSRLSASQRNILAHKTKTDYDLASAAVLKEEEGEEDEEEEEAFFGSQIETDYQFLAAVESGEDVKGILASKTDDQRLGKEELEAEEEAEYEVQSEAEEFEGEMCEGGWGEEQPTMKTKLRRPGKQTDYLKEQLGHILPKILAEIGWKRPNDPVHYLAHRLFCEKRQRQAMEEIKCFKMSLLSEKKVLLSADEQMPIKTFGYFETQIERPQKLQTNSLMLLDENEEEEEEEDYVDDGHNETDIEANVTKEDV